MYADSERVYGGGGEKQVWEARKETRKKRKHKQTKERNLTKQANNNVMDNTDENACT